MTNIQKVNLLKTLDYVPYCEIWKGRKFVRCADAIYNIAEFQISSNKSEFLSPANKYLKSILPVQIENWVL